MFEHQLPRLQRRWRLNPDAHTHRGVRWLRRPRRRSRRNEAQRGARVRWWGGRNAPQRSTEDEAFRCTGRWRWLLRRRRWRRRRRGRFQQQQLVTVRPTVCKKRTPRPIRSRRPLLLRRSAVRAATSAAEPVRRCGPLGDGRCRNGAAAAGLPDRCDGLPRRERAHRGLGRLRYRR